MSSSVSDLEPVSDYPGASPWFSAVSTPAVLRPGPHMAALQAAQFVRTWCDGCGRRRGADGRCPACDPWWTSPFYVYGSLLTIGVTALLLTVTSLLRASSSNVPDNSTTRVLAASPSFAIVGLPVAQIAAPSAAAYSRSFYVVPAPQPMPIVFPTQAADAGFADLARLRAMTDDAAGMETRRDATRTWNGISSRNVAPVPAVPFPRSMTGAPALPTTATPPSAPSLPVFQGAESAGESREGGLPSEPSESAPAATAPQRTL